MNPKTVGGVLFAGFELLDVFGPAEAYCSRELNGAGSRAAEKFDGETRDRLGLLHRQQMTAARNYQDPPMRRAARDALGKTDPRTVAFLAEEDEGRDHAG